MTEIITAREDGKIWNITLDCCGLCDDEGQCMTGEDEEDGAYLINCPQGCAA